MLKDAHWLIPVRWSCSTDALMPSRQLGFSSWSVLGRSFFRTGSNVRTLRCCGLNRLAREQTAEIIADVAGHKALPSEVYEQIITKSDGVPLFAEELTKAVLELDCFKMRVASTSRLDNRPLSPFRPHCSAR